FFTASGFTITKSDGRNIRLEEKELDNFILSTIDGHEQFISDLTKEQNLSFIAISETGGILFGIFFTELMKRIKFELGWLLRDGFSDMVKDIWATAEGTYLSDEEIDLKQIYQLRDGNKVIQGDEALKKHITSYYKSLFGTHDVTNDAETIQQHTTRAKAEGQVEGLYADDTLLDTNALSETCQMGHPMFWEDKWLGHQSATVATIFGRVPLNFTVQSMYRTLINNGNVVIKNVASHLFINCHFAHHIIVLGYLDNPDDDLFAGTGKAGLFSIIQKNFIIPLFFSFITSISMDGDGGAGIKKCLYDVK
ncbi:hypothetical protein ACJX0J_027159, partial [Zea mays]